MEMTHVEAEAKK